MGLIYPVNIPYLNIHQVEVDSSLMQRETYISEIAKISQALEIIKYHQTLAKSNTKNLKISQCKHFIEKKK